MKNKIIVGAALGLLSSISVQSDPPTTCPRSILTFYKDGTNFGRFWYCKTVEFDPNPPNRVYCHIDESNYYDVGEWDSTENQWKIYDSTPAYYNSWSINNDYGCGYDDGKVEGK